MTDRCEVRKDKGKTWYWHNPTHLKKTARGTKGLMSPSDERITSITYVKGFGTGTRDLGTAPPPLLVQGEI